jgi:3-oxoacyl-[acyl-carrier protein] reductase
MALSHAGACVIINYRGNQAAAEETLNALAVQGELCPFDVGEEAQVEQAAEKIVDQHKKIDILVNNAGVTIDNLLMRTKPAEWDQIIGTNLKGTILCTKSVSRYMIRQRYGRIINLSSVVGQTGNVGQSLYAASKAGIIGFTKTVAREVASRGVTVNAVAPGFIESDMTARLPEKLRQSFIQSIPLGRFGTCDEIAEMVVFLAGPGAGYITGQVFGVNGGLYM